MFEEPSLGTKRKLPPKKIAAARKKAASSKGPSEEPIDMAAELRRATRDMARSTGAINSGSAYASGRRGGRQAAPSKSDGQRNGRISRPKWSACAWSA